MNVGAGGLSKDVFERCTLTGSEGFSLTICLDAKKFVLLRFFSLIRTIYLRVSTKPPPNDAKRPLPVDVRHSKTLLLKLPITLPFTVWLNQTINKNHSHCQVYWQPQLTASHPVTWQVAHALSSALQLQIRTQILQCWIQPLRLLHQPKKKFQPNIMSLMCGLYNWGGHWRLLPV